MHLLLWCWWSMKPNASFYPCWHVNTLWPTNLISGVLSQANNPKEGKNCMWNDVHYSAVCKREKLLPIRKEFVDYLYAFLVTIYVINKNMENAYLNAKAVYESSFEIDIWGYWPSLYVYAASCRVLLLCVIFMQDKFFSKIKIPWLGSQLVIQSKTSMYLCWLLCCLVMPDSCVIAPILITQALGLPCMYCIALVPRPLLSGCCIPHSSRHASWHLPSSSSPPTAADLLIALSQAGFGNLCHGVKNKNKTF